MVPSEDAAVRPTTSPRGGVAIRTTVPAGDETIHPTSPGQMTIRPTSPGDVTIRPQTGHEATLPDEIAIISTVVEALSNVSTSTEAADNPVVEPFDHHQRPTMVEGRSDQRPPLNNSQHLTVIQTRPSSRFPLTDTFARSTVPVTGSKTHLALITEDLDRQIALLGETVEVFRRERDELRRVVECEKGKKKKEAEEVSGLMGFTLWSGFMWAAWCISAWVVEIGGDECCGIRRSMFDGWSTPLWCASDGCVFFGSLRGLCVPVVPASHSTWFSTCLIFSSLFFCAVQIT